MMTTYELIRRLVQLDPNGDCPVMLSVRYAAEQKEVEANGFIDNLSIEILEDGNRAIIVGAEDR